LRPKADVTAELAWDPAVNSAGNGVQWTVSVTRIVKQREVGA